MAPVRPNPTLSDDLISEILKRVPVKSLLCCQSVCKTWLSLIKHSAFVRSQLRHAIATEIDKTFIIGHINKKLLLLHVDSRQIVADVKFPYSKDVGLYSRDGVPCISLAGSPSGIVGSANGIVCVVVKKTRIIYLWNPATRQSKSIPCDDRKFCSDTFGFGYDPIDDDFKVVSVASVPSISAEVYSANNNCWRKMPDPIDFPWSYGFDVCVNGFLCCFGNFGMMTFDLNKEVMNCAIKFPIIFEDYDEPRIIEFNNSVAVIISRNVWNYMSDQKIDVWMLDDDACFHGGAVEASWTLMFSIDLVRSPDIVFGYFSNRDLLLLVNADVYKWILCNADKKEAKIFPLSVDMAGHRYFSHVYKYTESLVSLAGFEQVNWNAGEDDN